MFRLCKNDATYEALLYEKGGYFVMTRPRIEGPLSVLDVYSSEKAKKAGEKPIDRIEWPTGVTSVEFGYQKYTGNWVLTRCF